MTRAHTTLAIVAFTALFGCTVKAPASTPTTVQSRLQILGTESTFALSSELARRFADQYPKPSIEVRQGSFTTLMEQLDAGGIAYFTSSHIPVRADLWAAPLAIDGLAIIVNRQNPLTNLQIGDLRDIFAGKQSEWSALGGTATKIIPLTHQAGSDSYLEFQRMVMGKIGITGNARLVPNFRAMLRQVIENTGAVGYLPLSKLDDSVKILAINGVVPNANSMRNKRYPLRSTIFVIGRQAPPAQYHNFFGWIQSEAIQATLPDSYTPLP